MNFDVEFFLHGFEETRGIQGISMKFIGRTMQ